MHAQWAVTNPGNLAQGIVNSINGVVETSGMAQNVISTFRGASKTYEQSRKCYDMLKGVDSLVSGGLKVREPVLMLSEISEGHVMSYGRMLTDENYTQRESEAIALDYNNIMKKNSTSVAGLKDITDPTGMSMTDGKQLDLIERVYREMRYYRMLVSYYTRKNPCVSYLRVREKGEAEQALKLYGEDEHYW